MKVSSWAKAEDLLAKTDMSSEIGTILICETTFQQCSKFLILKAAIGSTVESRGGWRIYPVIPHLKNEAWINPTASISA
jgi:hypothetical protein